MKLKQNQARQPLYFLYFWGVGQQSTVSQYYVQTLLRILPLTVAYSEDIYFQILCNVRIRKNTLQGAKHYKAAAVQYLAFDYISMAKNSIFSSNAS